MVWTAPDITLVDEQVNADERTTLTEFLDAHRNYLLHKCAGLTGEQLARQSVPPSTLSLLGGNCATRPSPATRWTRRSRTPSGPRCRCAGLIST
ncbi:MAG TPA: DUF664 domain-containing protein [Pseudonocardiaceae bacterium]|jgi:hypothetical protein|nr:DUF664 domain-containing protein [Pseudonocardiaceae bacterium]